jgi:D-alanyl-D-alanine carboxypeptidase/D-alanyl-D-alanine-endopeptidase (penicillin-binding protein 4)
VKRALLLLALGLLVPSFVHAGHLAARRQRRTRPIDLVWHVETLDGQVVGSHQGDEAINPASVVKIATSLWALERLGPDFRYETRFFARGNVDLEHRTLHGDLIVLGSGDPDFHAENAFLVARALNEIGVERVTGALIVNEKFWIGWENGSAGREADTVRRGMLMAARLRRAFDPRRWDRATRATWHKFAARRGLAVGHPPRVTVVGGVGTDGDPSQGSMLVVHRSQPLVEILRRFDCYSNNDIERIAEGLGSVDELADLVAARCAVPRGEVEFETASGLGSNRLTPHIIVRLLLEFRSTCQRLGLPVEAVLPMAGCDPSTVSEFFPLLAGEPNTASVVAKTGTLTNTDGGVTVLAGFAHTAHGEFVFCVAAPHAARRLRSARRAEQRWVVGFLDQNGGAQPRPCAAPLPFPDADANVIILGDHPLPREVAPAAPTPPVTAPVN